MWILNTFRIRNLKGIQISLVIGPLTAITYGFTYMYYWAYNRHYKLPADFVEININRLSETLLLIIGIAVIILMAIGLNILFFKMADRLKEDSSLFKKRVGTLLMHLPLPHISLFCLLLLGGFIFNSGRVLNAIIPIGIFLVLFYFKKYITAVVTLLAGMIVITYSLGTANAAGQFEHLLIKDGKETLVVVNTYDDNYIAAPVDLKRKLITPEFEFIEMDNPVITTKLTNTGLLYVRDYSKNLMDPDAPDRMDDYYDELLRNKFKDMFSFLHIPTGPAENNR
ncbi:hypothetical protein [Neobacillus sp. 114]|uniref:hypothetical protein n=1 Tax=Neobacillus sp. 114 TaxID=3048535 RepID=UPI0024C3BAFB|nr:hypothetical protein [Neobacillus sp. 114]